MRIITLEEHVVFPEIAARITDSVPESQKGHSSAIERVASKLADVNGIRLQSMDANGIDVQVLSVVGPGADLLGPENGPAVAVEYNNAIAAQISINPIRFKAFAHLPMSNPGAAALELERAVTELGFCGALINGLTGDRFLDHPEYAVIFEKAQQLDVPLYLHPGLPPKPVADVYYSGLPKQSGAILSIAGWGWHSETALHVLRLIVSGIFDRYPRFKLIIGHMGEMLPMMMARCDRIFKPGENGLNERTISQTLRDQVYITTSGMFTQPPLTIAIATFGIDNIMFSVDYPFSNNEDGRKFLDETGLPEQNLEKIAHGNAERLLKLAVSG